VAEDLVTQRALNGIYIPGCGQCEVRIGFVWVADLEEIDGSVQPDECGRLRCQKVLELHLERGIDHLLIFGDSAASLYREYLNRRLRLLRRSRGRLLGMSCLPSTGRIADDLTKNDEVVFGLASSLSFPSDNAVRTNIFIGSKLSYGEARKAARSTVSICDFVLADSGEARLRPWWPNLKKLLAG